MCLVNATLETPTHVLLETRMPSHPGLVVTPGLVTLPSGVAKFRIPVEVTNNNNKSVTIFPKSVITCAQLSNEVNNLIPAESKATNECGQYV